MSRVSRSTSAHPPGRLRAFLAGESGSATIESVIWLPIFLIFLGILVDASMMFNNRTMVLKLVQDANRSRAVGRLDNHTQTEDYIRQRLAGMTSTAQISSEELNGIIRTRVELDGKDLDAIGLFNRFGSIKVVVQAQHMKED